MSAINKEQQQKIEQLICKYNEDLQPCPFCGGKAELQHTWTPHYWVQCQNCDAEVPAPGMWEEETYNEHTKSIAGAVTAWNLRSSDGNNNQR